LSVGGFYQDIYRTVISGFIIARFIEQTLK